MRPYRSVNLGVPAFESDLRCLFRSVDVLQGVDNDDDADAMILPVLDMVSIYCAFHFRRQERVMRAIGCPDSALHGREHAAFLRRLDSLKDTCAVRSDRETAGRLHDELSAWLCHHMLLFDVAASPYILDRELGEQLAREGAARCLVAEERPVRRVPPPVFGPYAASAMAT